eukprot:2735229-Amphidinium_carterae.1
MGDAYHLLYECSLDNPPDGPLSVILHGVVGKPVSVIDPPGQVQAARNIWTDGSACHSSEPFFRRASAAIIFEGGQE